MRGRASLLVGFAIVAACGHPFDTSVQPDPMDAGFEAGVRPGGASDAATAHDGAAGDDDDDAITDAEAGTDASKDATTDGGAGPTCTSFNETFPNPWSYQTQGWYLPPAQPYFVVTTYAELQASTQGSPNATYLRHALASDCRAHLRITLKISDDTTNIADVTMIHFGSAAIPVDIVRRKSGVLDAVYAGASHAIGEVNAGSWYKLDIDIPKQGGAVSIFLNDISAAQPLTMASTPSKLTEILIGVVEITNASAGVNGVVDVDDIQLNN